MSRPFDADFNRIILADVYPRKEDPFQPGAGVIPGTVPPASLLTPDQLAAQAGQAPNPFTQQLTQPSQRPVVYQTGFNITLNLTTVPQPIQASQFQCDGFIISVPSTATPSAFYGYGSGVSTSNGVEVKPGLPTLVAPDNTREIWELQRMVEALYGMFADYLGYSQLGQFRTPRVVMDASQWWLVSTAAVTIAVLLFNVPQQQ